MQTQLAEIDGWLRSVAPNVEGTIGDWDFWIGETTPLGFQAETWEQLPFILGFESFQYRHDYSDLNAALAAAYTVEAEDEQTQWVDHVGFYPACNLIVAAMVSRPPLLVNRILGYITLAMARCFGGWVRISGIVWPPTYHLHWTPDTVFPDPAFEKEPLPGRVLTFFRSEGQARRPCAQLLDVEAFAAWLEHPRFFLIK